MTSRNLWISALAVLLSAPCSADLVPGESVTRELSAGGVHTYHAVLDDGAWLVVAEQHGVDVVVEVAHGDETLASVDGPFDRQGRETLLVEVAAGDPLEVDVTVRAREPAAPPGRYELRLERLSDTKRLIAERALNDAGRHYQEGTADGWRQALAGYREARDVFRDLDRPQDEARALYAVAVLDRLLNENEPAIAAGAEVLTLWQRLGDRLWEAYTLNEMGLNEQLLGRAEEARAHFTAARDLLAASGDPFGEAMASANLCVMELQAGRLKEGRECYLAALETFEAAGAAQLEGAVRTNLGRIADLLGEPQEALRHYGEALRLHIAAGDRMNEARALANLGVLHRGAGRSEEALECYDRALEIFRQLGERRWQARVLTNIGYAYYGLADSQRALAHFDEALALWRELGDPRGQAVAASNLAWLYNDLGQSGKAIAFHHRAIELRRTAKDRLNEAVEHQRLAATLLTTGEVEAALAEAGEAADMLAPTGDLAHHAMAELTRGEALLASGSPEAALSSLERSIELARTGASPIGEARAHCAAARAKQALGQLAGARADVEAAIVVFEDLWQRLDNPDLRQASSAATMAQAYELYIDVLMETGDERGALAAAERARARTLLEVIAEARIDVTAGVEPGLLETRRDLLERLAAKTERAAEAPTPAGRRAALEEETALILRKLDLIEAEIRSRSPAYADLIRPRPLDTDEIEALLDPQTTLLYYALGERRSYLWVVSMDGVESIALPARAEIEAAARRAHDALRIFDAAGRADDAQALAALGKMVLAPAQERLRSTSRVAVVADGGLHYVPFAALPLFPEAPLVESHEVVVLPSASVLALQRSEAAARPIPSARLAVLADPVFDPHDPRVQGDAPEDSGSPSFERLPASRHEAETIAALVADTEPLVAFDFEASLPLVTSDRLRSYEVVHFATHGVIDTESPVLSGLVLSTVDATGRPQRGFLGLHDVYNLRLGAELVMLSGCRTALGRELRGEGLIGLVRGFMYAGARRVGASLWPVEDRATAALMGRFYRALWVDRQTPSAALRAAQRSIRRERRWRDPYFWAGFVLTGDWR